MTSQGETVVRCMGCDAYNRMIFEFEDEFGTLRICEACRYQFVNGELVV